MRITKTSKECRNEYYVREKANEGCYVCPGCGNTKVMNLFDVVSENVPREECITRMTFRTERSTLFTFKSGSIDKYSCGRCGTEWESEIY